MLQIGKIWINYDRKEETKLWSGRPRNEVEICLQARLMSLTWRSVLEGLVRVLLNCLIQYRLSLLFSILSLFGGGGVYKKFWEEVITFPLIAHVHSKSDASDNSSVAACVFFWRGNYFYRLFVWRKVVDIVFRAWEFKSFWGEGGENLTAALFWRISTKIWRNVIQVAWQIFERNLCAWFSQEVPCSNPVTFRILCYTKCWDCLPLYMTKIWSKLAKQFGRNFIFSASFSALLAGRFLPPGRILAIICLRGWVDPRAVGWKN
jgi:hypothetical protein